MKLNIKTSVSGSIGKAYIEIDYTVEVEQEPDTNDTPGFIEAREIIEFDVTSFCGDGDPYDIPLQDFADGLVTMSKQAMERAVEIVRAGDFEESEAA